MKIGLFSDLQLHTWHSFGIDNDAVVSRRLQDQINVLEQIYQIVVKEKIDMLIFGGDLFHKRGELPVECVNIIDEWIKKINLVTKLVLVRGNHDLFNDKKYHKYRDALNFLDSEFRHESSFEVNGLKIRTVDYHEKVDCERIEGYDLVILHKQPDLVNEYNHHVIGENWQQIASKNKLVFFGHYHKRIDFSNNCFTIGSPLALTFDDKDDRGMWIIDDAGVDTNTTYEYNLINDYAVAFIKLDYPKFITVNDSSEVVKNDGNYYRVLNAKKKSDDDTVINVVKPEYFDERIKSNDFETILHEWLAINSKSEQYLEVIRDIITDKMQAVRKLIDGQITTVSIKNFLSVADINFTVESGFTLVAGFNMDTNDSNGSGKTTLFESIFWCLFGETTKGLTGDDVIRRGQKDCEVSMLIQSKDKSYVVTRTRKSGLTVIVDDEDVTTGLRQVDKQEYLENSVLGFNKNIFMSSCYFSQENMVMFTGLSDAEKTNMLTKMLGFEMYEDLFNASFDKIKRLTLSSDSLVTDETNLNNEITKNKVRIDVTEGQIKTETDRIAECKVMIGRYDEKIAELKATNIADEDVVTVDYDVDIERLSLLEADALDGAKEASDTLTEKNNSRAKLLADVSSYQTEIRISNGVCDRLKKQIDNLGSLTPNERCDKCGSVITGDSIGIFVNEKQVELKSETDKIASLNEKILAIRDAEGVILTEMDVLKRQVSALTKSANEHKELVRNFNAKKFEQSERLRRVELRRNAIASDIRDYETKIVSLNKNIDVYTGTVRKCNDVIESVKLENEALTQKSKEKRSQIDVIAQDVEKLEFWRKSFSPTGIRALLLDRFCNEFNSLVNEYLSTISSGLMSIVVSPTKALKSGEARNKIGFDIYIGGIAVKYESMSGGEKRRIDVSLCLTLNAWVKLKYGLSHGLLGVLILDELFSYVDRSGEESIATMLYHEGRDKAIYVVSHTADLSSYGEKMITIVKRNGISEMGAS